MEVVHYWRPIQNTSIWTSNCVERSSRTPDLMAVETGVDNGYKMSYFTCMQSTYVVECE